MKVLKYLIAIAFILPFTGCNDDDFGTGFLDNAEAPSNLSALFTIAQDNSGLVTIQPNGEGVTSYTVDFGDGTSETETFSPGEKAQHTYPEGTFDVTITAMGITGKETQLVQQLTVSFLAPENLEVNISAVIGDPYSINVSATALYETFFEITFGDGTDSVQFNEGQTITHTYSEIGSYDIHVIAYSGGSAFTEYTQTVMIFDPLILPLTFESTTLNYGFTDFGGAETVVADNPSVGGINTSAKVAQYTKHSGAEGWAGSFLTLDEAIDFSEMQFLSVSTYSPLAGAVVRLKIENSEDSNVFVELDATTTGSNEWEELLYDFSGVDTSATYNRVVIFFDFGNNGNGDVFYFDNVKQSYGETPFLMPITFESPALDYSFTNFGGVYSQAIANPHSSGINTSANVGHFHKPANAEVWGGSFLDLDAPVDFSVLQKIKMKSWSPQAGITVLMKLENINNGNIAVEVPATVNVANEWEELVFDFSGLDLSQQYQRVVIFYNFESNGVEADYYFDDIEQTN